MIYLDITHLFDKHDFEELKVKPTINNKYVIPIGKLYIKYKDLKNNIDRRRYLLQYYFHIDIKYIK